MASTLARKRAFQFESLPTETLERRDVPALVIPLPVVLDAGLIDVDVRVRDVTVTVENVLNNNLNNLTIDVNIGDVDIL